MPKIDVTVEGLREAGVEDFQGGIGHNSVSADELRSLIERVESLEEDRKSISADVKDVYLEAKSRGFDTKTMRKVVRLRKLTREAFQAELAMEETYLAALVMI